MRDALKRALLPRLGGATAPRPGLHHFTREQDGRVIRYHLRVENDGSGTLIANASAATRLSSTGVAMATALFEGRGGEAARSEVRRAFRGAGAERVADDLRKLERVIGEMAEGGTRYPISSLDDPESTVHRRTLSAPLAAEVTVGKEDRVREILRRLWEVAIPQVTFCLPSGAPSANLRGWVEHAEDLGLIAGVRGSASDLALEGLVADLAAAGLDHLDLGWAGPVAAAHDALFGAGDWALASELILRCHALELCPVAVTPLSLETLGVLDALAADLAERRVGGWTVFALVEAGAGEGDFLGAEALRQAAATVEELADRHGLNLLWAPPVEHSPGLSLPDMARAGPRTTGEAGIRVEPDGTVLAPLGRPVPAGNLLDDDWNTLWGQAVFRRWRESIDDPPRCDFCPELAVCSAGCPTDPDTWARAPGGRP